MKKDHILVIRFSALGDVAMVVPVVYSLAKQHPDIRITMLSKTAFRPLFENLAPNIGFMGADLKREYKGLRGLNALYRRLTAKQFTAIADLHSVLRSEFLRLRFNMSRCRVEHINKHRKGRRKLTSDNNKQLTQQPTPFQNYVEVFERLGYSINIQFTSIFPSGRGDLSLLPESILSPLTSHPSPLIGIAPFAAHEGKIYPTPLMHEVIRQLTQQHPNARIFLFGRGEKEDQHFTERGTHPHEPPRRHAIDGLRQYALGFVDWHSCRQHLGGNTSLCRFYGLEPDKGQCHSGRTRLSSLQHLRTEALQAWRLCLYDNDKTRNCR